MFLGYLILLVVIIFPEISVAKIMCKNENNSDVDWYIAIKYPASYNYLYLSSDSGGKDWKLPNYALSSDKNFVALTLKQAYDAKDNKSFYAFYNDEKSKTIGSASSGHLKGVLNFDHESGYWMVHSVPKFPPTKQYSYPDPQHINGQSFICVSLKFDNLNLIATQLLMMYAPVYSFYLPEYFSKNTTLESNLFNLVHNLHYPGIKANVINLTTVSNVPLVHFGKSKDFNNDLYDLLIAPGLKSSLYVESWMNGNGGRESSNCKSTYKVYNVKKVKLNNMEFDEGNDHSKWAVTTNGTSATCIGDINRMKSQFDRGGGSLCIFQSDVWRAFQSAVFEYEKCSNS